ncbi:Coenzyme A biosynthesis bifunctional protein CoaBC, partial [Haemophilus influenzae]
TQKS